MPLGPNSLSIPGWLMRGAIREDDSIPPHDDPDNNGLLIRPLSHFYDPVHKKPLTFLGITLGKKAPDWALGVNDFLATPTVPKPDRDNHFTILDAREAMYRALTGRNKALSKAIIPNANDTVRVPKDSVEAEKVRKAYWATTFRSLGDVIHLVEDLAQPQHTRNDAHMKNGILDKTIYELYTEVRALGSQYTCGNGKPIPAPGLDYGTYPKPQFNNYSDYFSTVKAGELLSGKGMADYSNRGFFTAGTNIRDDGQPDGYAYPQASAMTSVAKQKNNPCIPTAFTGVSAVTGLMVGSVPDTVSPSYVDKNSAGAAYDPTGAIAGRPPLALSAKGLFNVVNNARQSWDTVKKYTLTDDNYNTMADLLIPRAVAYSVGLLDYFFRGRMEITLPDEGIYAIADHATPHGSAYSGKDYKPLVSSGADAGNVFGFTRCG